ncbi:protein of unknown function (plasmid) [Caballeronia sp. S22]
MGVQPHFGKDRSWNANGRWGCGSETFGFSPDPVGASVYQHCPSPGRGSLSLLLQRK